MNQEDLSEYIRASEPHKRQRAENWRVAIGLQKVDGLNTSEFLVDAARRNIEGEISLAEVRKLLDGYYKARSAKATSDERTEEADKVSQRIAEILDEPAFTFAPSELISIHRRLFAGIFKHAGRLRDYNITKSEWVLRGDTVFYATADSLLDTLSYDFGQERDFSYARLSKGEAVRHFSRFISRMWQIHPFGEGNTRTTAVFTVKYLRSLGFNVSNEPFAENSWYFRNALVRANYADYAHDVKREWSYLEAFFRNLLRGERNELKSRYLLIGLTDEDKQKIRKLTDPGSCQKKAGRKRGKKTTQKTTQKMAGRTTQKMALKILSVLRRNPNATRKDIVAVTGLTDDGVKWNLRKLKAAGLLRRIGPDKGGHWEVVEGSGE